MKISKSKFFSSKEGMFEFENVSAVLPLEGELLVMLFGDCEISLKDATNQANFLLWYEIYLEEKYAEEVEETEEIGL